MLKIRFSLKGRRSQPLFRIVVVESNKPRNTNDFVDHLGFYNPITKEISIRYSAVKEWIGKGAQCTPAVFNLLKKSS